MRSVWVAVAVIALVLPTVAAAEAAGHAPVILDLRTGVTGELLGKTMGLAKSFFVFCFILALVVEAFGRSPLARRDYGGVVFRAVIVLMLLSFYGPLFGTVINLAEGVGSRVTPDHIWEKFTRGQQGWQDKLFNQKSEEDKRAEESLAEEMKGDASFAGSLVGGYVFDSFIAAALLIGQAAHWVLGTLARVLAVLLYVLGPLALVFSIPRTSGAGGQWFRTFVSVLCWPVMSGLLLTFTVTIGMEGMALDGASTAFGTVASALLLSVIALATPKLTSIFVSGTASILDSGMGEARRWSQEGASVGTSARSLFTGSSGPSAGSPPAPAPAAPPPSAGL